MFVVLVDAQGHQIQIAGSRGQCFHPTGFVVSKFDAAFRPERQDANVLAVGILVPAHSVLRVLKSIAKDVGNFDVKVSLDFGTQFLELEKATFVACQSPAYLLLAKLIAVVFIGMGRESFSKEDRFGVPREFRVVVEDVEGFSGFAG